MFLWTGCAKRKGFGQLLAEPNEALARSVEWHRERPKSKSHIKMGYSLNDQADVVKEVLHLDKAGRSIKIRLLALQGLVPQRNSERIEHTKVLEAICITAEVFEEGVPRA